MRLILGINFRLTLILFTEVTKHGKPRTLVSISADNEARLRDEKDPAKYNTVEGLCIRAMYGGECNGEKIKRTWRPKNNNLEKLMKRFKRSIMFISSMKIGPDSEGEDRDQEQVDEMNNFLEEENEATEIEESVDHTQYPVPC